MMALFAQNGLYPPKDGQFADKGPRHPGYLLTLLRRGLKGWHRETS